MRRRCPSARLVNQTPRAREARTAPTSNKNRTGRTFARRTPTIANFALPYNAGKYNAKVCKRGLHLRNHRSSDGSVCAGKYRRVDLSRVTVQLARRPHFLSTHFAISPVSCSLSTSLHQHVADDLLSIDSFLLPVKSALSSRRPSSNCRSRSLVITCGHVLGALSISFWELPRKFLVATAEADTSRKSLLSHRCPMQSSSGIYFRDILQRVLEESHDARNRDFILCTGFVPKQ